MATTTKNDDQTVKVSKKAIKELESKAKPFESKKDCIERMIMENCGRARETKKPKEKPIEGSEE